MAFSELTMSNVVKISVSAPKSGASASWRTVAFHTADGARFQVCAYSDGIVPVPLDTGTGARGNVGTVDARERDNARERLQLSRAVLFSLLDSPDITDVLNETERNALRTVLAAAEPFPDTARHVRRIGGTS